MKELMINRNNVNKFFNIQLAKKKKDKRKKLKRRKVIYRGRSFCDENKIASYCLTDTVWGR